MRATTKRRVHAFIDGATRSIDIAGAGSHDPRRYAALARRSVGAALADDWEVMGVDFVIVVSRTAPTASKMQKRPVVVDHDQSESVAEPDHAE
jgi:benzoyl-CoA reductase/2-hydroxyglutaryl-CoA dehydratase subunit BcrC/BadD/HgdB